MIMFITRYDMIMLSFVSNGVWGLQWLAIDTLWAFSVKSSPD